MKKQIFTLTLALTTALAAFAIPAKKGLWQTLRLADGTEVRAQMTGDEHAHFWQTEDGERYTVNEDGIAVAADMEQLTRRAMKRRSYAPNGKLRKGPRRVTIGEQTHYTGKKKGLVILMQFKNTKFKAANNNAKYNDILNKENYTTSPFKGSVADYFKAQSGGIFELNFDVVGPYTASNDASYYGANDNNGNDMHPDQLVSEAVKAANSSVDFNDYDWDGDGEVDQVFVLYAGTGEADGGSSNTIWPHMWYLSDTDMDLNLDGVHIDTYACANEIMPDGTIEGIGCFCHEFSHCLGFPDFYDTSYSGWYGTGEYDLMCAGSYNGNSYRPAGYNAYEKWMAGWIEPIELDKEGVTVEDMQPMSNGGEAYIIYNDGNSNEYYLVENRQKIGWDTSLPGKGLLITHVDFDSQIWEENNPNTKVEQYNYFDFKPNDHQRFSIICADNSATTGTASHDLFPYSSKNSLTDTSTPRASLFNKNTDGTKLMHKPITDIKQNSDYTMSFLFRGGYQEPDSTQVQPTDSTQVEPGDTTIVIKGDTLLYESFNECSGTGGNDGQWNGSIAQSKFNPDCSGWVYEAAYAADACARFGNKSKKGTATTPALPIDGEATLTFKAAAWDTTSDGTDLTVTASNGVKLSQTQFTLPKGEWGEFTLTLSGKGNTKITFTPSNRLFLDEVLVKKVKAEPNYDVDGNGTVDVRDLTELLANVVPLPGQNSAADINGDGTVNIADIMMLINKLQDASEK